MTDSEWVKIFIGQWRQTFEFFLIYCTIPVLGKVGIYLMYVVQAKQFRPLEFSPSTASRASSTTLL